LQLVLLASLLSSSPPPYLTQKYFFWSMLLCVRSLPHPTTTNFVAGHLALDLAMGDVIPALVVHPSSASSERSVSPAGLMISGNSSSQAWVSPTISSTESTALGGASPAGEVNTHLVNALRGWDQQEGKEPEGQHERHHQRQQSPFMSSGLLEELRAAVRAVTAGEVMPESLQSVILRLQEELKSTEGNAGTRLEHGGHI